MKYHPRTLLFIILVIGILLVCSLDTYAQCSMCRAALSGANNGKFIRNLNIGILVLLLPPVSIFCSIFIILRRNRGEGVKKDHESPQV
jgi:energy-coupling factor transporter transmembrane protein EcfT